MFKKISILILIPIFCFSCGYTPMYSKNVNKQFKIELLDFEGDREISKNLKFNLEKNNYPDANQKVVISAITNYTKSSETKNLEGNIESYNLAATVIFKVKYNNVEKIFQFSENSKMKAQDNKYNELSYEKDIKMNFAKLFTNKIILQFSRLK